jgi:hypothetical protein
VADLLRISAVARTDPEPETELADWRKDLELGHIDDPEETRARLAGYECGEWVLVRLDVFVQALRDGVLARYPAGFVSGCWFEVDQHRQNVKHAQEMIANNLERIHEDLTAAGVDVPFAALEQLDILVEFEAELGRKLSM